MVRSIYAFEFDPERLQPLVRQLRTAFERVREAVVGVCRLAGTAGRGARRSLKKQPAEQGAGTAPLQQLTLGQIVASFKYQSTKRINTMRGTPGCRLWQRNYYERVIRDEEEHRRLRRSIRDNPLKWALDRENPANRAGRLPRDGPATPPA